MLITTTHVLQGKDNIEYLSIVSGEVILGVNAVKDIKAGFTNIFGGRSGSYEKEVQQGRMNALKEMEENALSLGADAIIGTSFVVTGINQGMIIITVSGTAIKY